MAAYFPKRFQAYSPHVTFSKPLNFAFFDCKGKDQGELDSDTYRLFCIGREAYQRLIGEGFSGDEEHLLSEYRNGIENWRSILSKMDNDGMLRFKTPGGLDLDMGLDWLNVESDNVLRTAMQVFTNFQIVAEPDIRRGLYILNLLHALMEIDNALIGICLDGKGAVSASIEAADALSNALAIESGNEKLMESRREFALKGAMAKIDRDPKQRAKQLVFECWQNWQAKPDNYKTKADFARDMLDKSEHLKSQKKIEDWCRAWEKEKCNPAS